jgi:hypothetical protein
MAVPNPFAPIDHLEFDVELPALPHGLERLDDWFNRLSELQRIGVALLFMLFLAASSLYCLGLGSTVLVNRAEATMAAQEAAAAAAAAAAVPTAVPTANLAEPPPPTAIRITATPAPRLTAAPSGPTQVGVLPTPIPAQLLPTVPIQAPQRQAAPVDVPRPRIVAPYEPPTPTPPAVPTSSARPAPAGTANTTVRGPTPTPAFGAPGILRTPPPAATARPGGTSAPAPAAKPTSAPAQATSAPVAKPTSAPIFTNPFPATPAPKPGTTPVAKPSNTR